MEVDLSHLMYVLITVLLGVNAFFIKDLVKSINEVKLELGKLVTEHSNSKATLGSHSEDLKELYKRTNDQEARLAVLENRNSSIEARLVNVETKDTNSK